MSQYFPQLYERSVGNVQVKLNLFNYATKTGATNIDSSLALALAPKTNLTCLKTKVDNLHINKVKTDLSILSMI